MGDGIVRKYAVVVNGDIEPKHQKNVEDATARLREMGYETFVASTAQPNSVDSVHYAAATQQEVARLLDGVRRHFDDDDDVVIYTTGHGDNTKGALELCLADGCQSAVTIGTLLDTLPGNQRTVIMDQCYSGNWGNRFLDDPRTLFIAAGSNNESTCCQYFSPRFWSAAVPDVNRDGTVSWQERYAYAMADTQRTISFPQLHPSPGYVEPGKAPFASSVTNISTLDGMQRELARLQPGQYAIVTFSASWCGPCKSYAPYFDSLAKQSKGQHLFLRTEDESIGETYGHRGFPTVMIIDYEGRKFYVANRRDVFEELSQLSLSLPDRLESLRKKMVGEDEIGQIFSAFAYKKLAAQFPPDLADTEARAFFSLLMRSPSAAADKDLLDAYKVLVSKITPAEAAAQLRVCRQTFDHVPLGATYPNAVLAYRELTYRVDSAARRSEVQALGVILATLADRTAATLDDLNTLETFAQAYDRVKYDWSGMLQRENTETLQRVRALFAHRDLNIQKGAIQAYAMIAQGLAKDAYAIDEAAHVEPREIRAGAQALLPWINHPDRAVRNNAVWGLKAFFTGLSASEVARLLPDIIDQVASGRLESKQASYLCEDLVHKVPASVIAREAPRIRALLPHRKESVAQFAYVVYLGMLPRFTAKEASLGAELFRKEIQRGIQRNESDNLRAYTFLLQEHRFSGAEMTAGAVVLRARLMASPEKRQEWKTLLDGYEKCLRDRRVARDEIVAGAKALIAVLTTARSITGVEGCIRLLVMLAKQHRLPRDVLSHAIAQLTILATSSQHEQRIFQAAATKALKMLQRLAK